MSGILGLRTITLLRYGAPVWTGIRAGRPDPASTPILASVDTAPRSRWGEDDSGNRTIRAIDVITRVALFGVDTEVDSTAYADRLVVDGRTYEVHDVTRMDPFEGDPVAHYEATALEVAPLDVVVAPVVPSLGALISGARGEGDTVTAVAANVTGTGPFTYAYAWQTSPVGAGTWTTVGTLATWTDDEDTLLLDLRVIITATGGTGLTGEATSQVLTGGGEAPVVPVWVEDPEVSGGSVRGALGCDVGDTITCSAGLTEPPADSVAYTPLRNGIAVGPASPAASREVVEADAGAVLTWSVVATTDGVESAPIVADGALTCRPHWSVDPAPDPLSEPWAGGGITWSDGTVLGAVSVTYDVELDGAPQGHTAATWTAPSGVVGDDVVRTARATNSGGYTDVASAALTVLALVPIRGGASDRYLRDGTGQIADSGTPDYAYDGTTGGVLLGIDDTDAAGDDIIAGDTVGTPWARDAVSGLGVGTLASRPWSTRASDGTGAAPSDSAYLMLTPAVGDSGTVVVRARRSAAAATQGLFSRADDDGIVLLWSSTGEGRLSMVGTGGVLLTLNVAGAPSGVDLLLAAEWDRSTPGSGTGTAKLALYRLDTGAQVGTTQTGTYATATIEEDSEGFLGRSKAAGSPALTTLLRWQEFAGAKLITSGVIADVVDGSDPTAGGTLSRDVGGLRTGVYDPGDSTRLIYAAGSGDAVEAGGST